MAAQTSPADPVIFKRLTRDNTCLFAVAGEIIRLPHRDTIDWFAALADEELGRIIPGMLRRRDRQWLMTELANPRSTFDMPQLRRVAHNIVREVTGIPWWAAARLANAAGRAWFQLDPSAYLRGGDLTSVPIRRALSIVYFIAAEGCENDRDRAILDSDLFRAPEGENPGWSAEQQATSMAAFRAMRAQFRNTTAISS
jgi:hypothetical protein